MKKRILISMLMAVVAVVAACAQITDGSYWTDGIVSYKAKVLNGGKTVVMEGGTLHEGGYKFVLKRERKSAKEYTILPGDQSDSTICIDSLCHKGDELVLYNIGGYKILQCYHSHLFVAALQKFDGNLERFMKRDRYEAYAGVYEDMKTGEKWHFTTNGKYAVGSQQTYSNYVVIKQFDMPSDVIALADGTLYQVQLTEHGMNLRACKASGLHGDQVDEETMEFGEVVAVLNRTASAYGVGKWSICEKRPLSKAMLNFYDEKTLKLMIGEMFARSGIVLYDDQHGYFCLQPWFKPRKYKVPKVYDISGFNFTYMWAQLNLVL